MERHMRLLQYCYSMLWMLFRWTKRAHISLRTRQLQIWLGYIEQLLLTRAYSALWWIWFTYVSASVMASGQRKSELLVLLLQFAFSLIMHVSQLAISERCTIALNSKTFTIKRSSCSPFPLRPELKTVVSFPFCICAQQEGNKPSHSSYMKRPRLLTRYFMYYQSTKNACSARHPQIGQSRYFLLSNFQHWLPETGNKAYILQTDGRDLLGTSKTNDTQVEGNNNPPPLQIQIIQVRISTLRNFIPTSFGAPPKTRRIPEPGLMYCPLNGASRGGRSKCSGMTRRRTRNLLRRGYGKRAPTERRPYGVETGLPDSLCLHMKIVRVRILIVRLHFNAHGRKAKRQRVALESRKPQKQIAQGDVCCDVLRLCQIARRLQKASALGSNSQSQQNRSFFPCDPL